MRSIASPPCIVSLPPPPWTWVSTKPGSTIAGECSRAYASATGVPSTRRTRPSRCSSVPFTKPCGVRIEPAISPGIGGFLRETQTLADQVQRAVDRVARGFDQPNAHRRCEPRSQTLTDASGDDQWKRARGIERNRDFVDPPHRG